MDSNFLQAADRGSSHLKHYALAFFFAIVGVLGLAIVFSLVVVIYRLASGLPLQEFSLQELSCHSELLFLSVVSFFWVSNVFFMTVKIYKRHPKTLINTEEPIRLKRSLSGCSAWCLIRVLSSCLFALFYPKFYAFSGITKIDISLTALGIIFSFLVSLSSAVLIAYILQGLNHLIKNSRLSIVYFILFIATILLFSRTDFKPLIFLLSVLRSLFLLFMILKEEGIELNIGWLMANVFYDKFCVKSTIESGNQVLSECTTFFLAQSVPSVVSFLVAIAQIAIFYYLFFVDRDRNLNGAT